MLRILFNYAVITLSGLFDHEYYLTIYPDIRDADVNPAWHYVRIGWKENRNPSPSFDTKYYIIGFKLLVQQHH